MRCGPGGSPVEVVHRVRRRRRGGCIAICGTSRFAVLRRRVCSPTSRAVIYLAALNSITGSTTGIVDGLFQVAVYNVIWFSLPIFALVMAQRKPDVTRELLDRLRRWMMLYRRRIVVVFLVALGGYLVVTGIVHLAQSAS